MLSGRQGACGARHSLPVERRPSDGRLAEQFETAARQTLDRLARRPGRPKAMDKKKAAMARSMHRDKNLTVKEICETLGIGKTTFYRYVNAD